MTANEVYLMSVISSFNTILHIISIMSFISIIGLGVWCLADERIGNNLRWFKLLGIILISSTVIGTFVPDKWDMKAIQTASEIEQRKVDRGY